MGLTLITGRANSGKTGLLYDRVRECARRGEGPVVLFPTTPDAERARAEFAEAGEHGIRVAVLDRWLAELWMLSGDGRIPVGEATRDSLIARAIAAHAPASVSGSARYRGFADSLCLLARRLPRPRECRAAAPQDREILEILGAYSDELARRDMIEPAEIALLLAEAPPAGLPPVFVNRFSDLAEPQERVVRAFSRSTAVSIALTWEAGHPATAVLDPLVERLAQAGEHVTVPTPDPAGELETLEATLFRGAGRVEPRGAVGFVEAGGRTSEAREALRIVADELSRGQEPSRVVITFKAAEERLREIVEAAGEAGVPIHVDLLVSLPATPLGAALLALLDVAAGRDATRERLGTYLVSDFSGVSARQAADLDLRARRARARGSALLAEVAALGGQAAETVRAARRCTADGARTATAADWKQLAGLLLRNAESRRGSDALLETRDAATHRSVLDVVAAAYGAEERPGSERIRLALGRARVPMTTGDRREGVHFTEAHRVRGTRYDMVVLGGLNAGELSAAPDPSWVNAFIDRVGGGELSAAGLAERQLFYALVTRARRRLVLMRSAEDEGGRPERPSVFWEEAADLYRDLGADGGDCLPRPAPDAAGPRQAHAEPVRSVVRGVTLGGEAGAAMAATEEFSVTELETYLHCPYRWFFHRALRPAEIDVEFGVREVGSLAHEALASFYADRLTEPGGGRVTSANLGEAREAAEAICADLVERRARPQGMEEEAAAARVRQWVLGIVEDDATFLPGFEPVEVELRFGAATERPFALGGVALRGSIDRVDRGPAGVVVTDYKSSGTVKGHGSYAKAGLIQVPVYAAAAAALLGGEPVGGVYRSLKTRRARGFWVPGVVDLCGSGTGTDGVDEDGVRRVLAEAAEAVASAAEGIRAGRIPARPLSPEVCRSCGAADTCPQGGAE